MKNKKTKLMIIFTLLLISIILLIIFVPKFIEYERIKHAKIIVTLKENLTIPFNEEAHISDFIESINGKINNDKKINTVKLGKQTINFKYTNDDDIVVPYSYEIEVIDNTEPIIWLGGKYTVTKGYKGNLESDIMCADDTDDTPECHIEGEYDTNEVGTYNLTFIATDKSGNTKNQEFILDVKEPSNQNSTSIPSKTLFSDAYSKYKSDDTKVGIDVSAWQGDIDFERVKEAGVEFAILRVGSKTGENKEYFVDSKFIQNIEGFNKVGIPVGLYFYSYSENKKESIMDAKWIIEQIKDYKVDLPIAYDWENWSKYKSYHLSLYNLSNNAKVFLDTLKKSGYDGMLYSSKSYLEGLWMDIGYPTWLAHYTSETNYEGEYTFWQFCSNGVVDGINGDVDLDVMYLND